MVATFKGLSCMSNKASLTYSASYVCYAPLLRILMYKLKLSGLNVYNVLS